MSDLYTELLVKRITPPGEKAWKLLLITATVLAAFAGLLITPLAFIVLVVLCVLDYLFLPSFDLEFEYLYVNGELDIDKIMSKSKRKRVESIDMDHVELIAPANSHELDYHKQNQSIKVVNYSSRREDAKVYAALVSKESSLRMIMFEPNNVILEDMKRIAPRKVKLS